MFHIIQSNDINRLFEFLLEDYQQKNRNIFAPFMVIVPSKVMGDWLKKQVADRAGISTLVTTEFWGRYQWTLMQAVLKEYANHYPDEALRVPEVAVLSKNVMQWRIFGYLSQQKTTMLNSPAHPLNEFIQPLLTQKEKHDSDENSTALSSSLLTSFISQNQTDTSGTPNTNVTVLSAKQLTDDQRLWQFADDMAKMFTRYMTYRPEWLEAWGKYEALDVANLITQKEAFFANLNGEAGNEMPDWLVAHYVALEHAQRFLWQGLFAPTFEQRLAIEAQFWQALKDTQKVDGQNISIGQACRAVLPHQIILFTVQQLPPSELKFMGQLAYFTDIKLLHQNPSQMFWADIVDKNWYISRRFIKPESVYLKDYGHTLLSRFGKQSREVFTMLADLSGNDDNVVWEDAFVENAGEPQTLLAQLQQDILMLSEEESQYKIEDILNNLSKRAYRPTRNWQINGNANHSNLASDTLAKTIDNSLSIHACYGIVRQLEVLRSMISGWLNYVDIAESRIPIKGKKAKRNTQNDSNQMCLGLPQAITGEQRMVSDILVLLPDLEGQQSVIEAIFPNGVGTDGYELPAKVTGVVSKDINQLWQAMTGYFSLLGRVAARFDKASVFDWLMLTPLYQSYALSHEEMSRACELLELAGFRRGFDEVHLATSLNPADDDYRFSFAYALDRLVMGVLMPQADSGIFPAIEVGNLIQNTTQISADRVLPLPQIQMNDANIVAVLSEIYQTLHRYRHINQQQATAEDWLRLIEDFIHEKFAIFEQTNALNAIWAARNTFRNNLKANSRYQVASETDTLATSAFEHNTLTVSPETLPLKFNFILSSMANELESQQVSAEPSGVITFGRIGAVRNLPYKLVVMLNLNLADFPQRDNQNRFDLMQAMLGRRGDRFREDDELGAFLDAILSAEENCWLFYNGGSVNDRHEHLPASPVQELISFFRNEVTWQTSQDITLDSQLHQFNKAELVTQWLITKHPALPFDKQYFYPSHNEHVETAMATQINHIKNSQKPLYPPARIWQSVFEKIQQNSQVSPLLSKREKAQSSHHQTQTNNPSVQFEIWDKKYVTTWLKAWQVWQSKHSNAENHALTAHSATAHINLTAIIKSAQNPALHFIQNQQIHLPADFSEAQNNEPIDLDTLGVYQINTYILQQMLAQPHADISRVDNNTTRASIEQKLQNLPFSPELPAGVSRHLVIKTQYQQIQQACEQLISKIQHDDDTTPKGFTLLKDQIQQYPAQATPLSALEQIAQLITPCQEQRLAVTVVCANKLTEKTPLTTIPPISYIVTANLPILDNQKRAPQHWIHYLPTNGKPKHQLAFWLNHLCWQVLRKTTPEQVASEDGFSLWQFSTHTTLYLPPIDHTQAYRHLQNWLMFYQLAAQSVVVLPPVVIVGYLTTRDSEESQSEASKTDDKNTPKKARPPSFGKLLAKAGWTTQGYNTSGYVSDNDPEHPTWALLLAGRTPLQAIAPFADSLGNWLYAPILQNLQVID